MALIAQAATLEARLPFMHFFDGFRTSHEIQKIEELTHDDMRAMIDDELVAEFRRRSLSPEHPTMRGTAQNPDVYFQGRETVNPYYLKTPAIVQKAMDRFAKLTGRQYRLFDYVGAPDADRVVVMMGSGGETMHEVVEYLNKKGEKVGVLKVRLYRPFDSAGIRGGAAQDRHGASPCWTARRSPALRASRCTRTFRRPSARRWRVGTIARDAIPLVVGGRYGLASKEFNAGMAKSVLDNLKAKTPKNHFTVGIVDDVTDSSLAWDDDFESEPEGAHRAMFYGLGADGTVGANKNSIKIIGKSTDYYAQGYFVYDSKKSGSMTISHLRFSPHPIRSVYLINKAEFLACHAFPFLERVDMLGHLRPGGTFLLNSPYPADQVWDRMPAEVQQALIDKKAKFYVIDAYSLAKSLGLGGRINVIMQTAFFAISGVLPQDKALKMIELAVEDTYGDKGQAVVDMNIRAASLAAERIQKVELPAKATSKVHMRPPVPAGAPEFVQKVTAEMIAYRGDRLPVSLMPADGTYPTGTTKYEKRNIALEIPVWEPEVCIQCNQCSFVCPHATIRVKAYEAKFANGNAPATFKSIDYKGKEYAGMKYTVQVAPEDCTGCGACVYVCPAFAKDEKGQKTERKAINMAAQPPIREAEAANWDYFLSLPDPDPKQANRFTVKGSQFLPAMFEFSGACGGCGETPYIKLVTQLFGDRMVVANATGCSSIYGANLPTTPYVPRADGRGPAWSNSLFEDNAEFGMGMRLTADKLNVYARELLGRLRDKGQAEFIDAILSADLSAPEAVEEQRVRLDALRAHLAGVKDPDAERALGVLEYLVPRSVWIIGGDGWAYDIGYGGLDHVLASGRNVNMLVLDTGVYSNTGGQASKATPRAAVAKFAAAGKDMPKKDLGAIAMTYGNIYVAQVAYGANIDSVRARLPRSGSLSGAVADHRLRPLYQPGHRHDDRHRPAEGRRRERLLAAVPLRPGAGRRGQEPAAARTRRHRPRTSRSSCTSRCASRCCGRRTRSGRKCCLARCARMSSAAGSSTSRWQTWTSEGERLRKSM